MIDLVRTNAQNKDFIQLVEKLDAYLTTTDGDEHAYYDQYNKLDDIKHVVLAYSDRLAVACGAIKKYDNNTMEVKRMFTSVEHRKKGIAGQVLAELEKWTKELSYPYVILETGKKQVEAVEFYQKNHYKIIPNYGQYIDIDNSVCFEKKVIT